MYVRARSLGEIEARENMRKRTRHAEKGVITDATQLRYLHDETNICFLVVYEVEKHRPGSHKYSTSDYYTSSVELF